jgi:hypothetical protein
MYVTGDDERCDATSKPIGLDIWDRDRGRTDLMSDVCVFPEFQIFRTCLAYFLLVIKKSGVARERTPCDVLITIPERKHAKNVISTSSISSGLLTSILLYSTTYEGGRLCGAQLGAPVRCRSFRLVGKLRFTLTLFPPCKAGQPCRGAFFCHLLRNL